MPKGLQLQQFGFNFYDLAPDEALVLDFDVPDARYWSLQLYKMAWFTPLDIGRTTSLNHAQTARRPGWARSRSSSRTTIPACPTGSTPRAAARAS